MFHQHLTQHAMPLAALPINIVFHHSGLIAFVRTCNFQPIVEHLEDNMLILDSECVKCVNKELVEIFKVPYNSLVDWKDKPVLLKWLKDFNLELPTFN